MGHDVRAPLKGAAVDRCGEGVVHHQRYAVGVGGLGKLFNVQHGQGGVCDGLAEHNLGVRPEGGVQLLLGAQRIHEGGGDAHFSHGDRDEVEGTAVDGAGGHDVVPCLAEIEQGKEVCGLSAGGEHGGSAALQLADLFGYHVAGGVLQAGIKIAVCLQIEQLAHVLAGGVLEGGGLDDGDLTGLAVAGGVAALHTDGITVHTTYSFACFLVGKDDSPQEGLPPAGNRKFKAFYFRRRLSLLVAHRVPTDWNACTISTSSTTQTIMILVW